MKNFLRKPWTWGTYLIVCAVGLVVTGLCTAITLGKFRKR